METISLFLRQCLSNALMQFNDVALDRTAKVDLYRVLKVSETQGWTWSSRTMYGGGTEVTLRDGHDDVAYVILPDYPLNAPISVGFMEEYLTEGFEPTELMPYNEELDAELRNEEALYKYELPRPWRDAWYVQKQRNWGQTA
jgi:hypothetical protein